jgi:hypothetical protein
MCSNDELEIDLRLKNSFLPEAAFDFTCSFPSVVNLKAREDSGVSTGFSCSLDGATLQFEYRGTNDT